MSMTVDGGGVRPQPTPSTPPADAPKADAAKTDAPAPKADAPKADAPKADTAAPAAPANDTSTYKADAPKDQPVDIQPSYARNSGDEIPMNTGFSSSSLSASDFPDSGSTMETGGAGTGNPNISVDSVKDAKFEKVDGQPFIKGAGDKNDIEWNDIQQGQLGDCYFMSSLGSIAQQNPDVIRNAIKDNGNGTYTVRFYEKKGDGPFGIGGLFGANHYEPKDITVSGDFPMKNGQPVFAGMLDQDGAKRELWPAIMEKAYAQMKGSYGSISGGVPARAMEMLTGKDSSSTAASAVTLDQLDKAMQSGQGMVAASLQNGDKKTPYANGTLVGKHAYMITGVDKGAGTVTLRNPWGPGTPDIKMSIADFNKNFDRVDFNPLK